MIDGIPNRPLYLYQKDMIDGCYSKFLVISRTQRSTVFFLGAPWAPLPLPTGGIVGVMRQSGCEVPDWMLRLKPKSKKAIGNGVCFGSRAIE